MSYPYLIKASSITVCPPGRPPITVQSGQPNFSALRAAITAGDWTTVDSCLDLKTFITLKAHGSVEIASNSIGQLSLLCNGVELSDVLAKKILTMFNSKESVDGYMAFLNNLLRNPSETSRQELYLFLEASDLPITENGTFLAYKAVTSDYKDKYTRKIDNSIGVTVPRMAWSDVDPDRHRTCSRGYHAAAYTYARNFMHSSGDRLVVVEINPADVVAVPSDYNNQKLRCTTYKVLYEIANPDIDTLTGRPFAPTSEASNYSSAYDAREFDDNFNDEDADIADEEDDPWNDDGVSFDFGNDDVAVSIDAAEYGTVVTVELNSNDTTIDIVPNGFRPNIHIT